MIAQDSAGARQLEGVLVTAGAALSISINSIAVPTVYAHGANPQTVVLLRYAFFIFAFLAAWSLIGRSLALAARHRRHALISGTFAAAGSVGLLGAYAFIPVSLAIVLVYTYPILTALMLAALQRRAPGFVALVCLVLALAGVVLIIGIEEVVLDPRGLALAALGAAGFAGAIVWNALMLRAADSTLVSFYMSLSGLVVIGALVIATGSFAPPSAATAGWLAMLISAACFSAAFVGMYRGVQLIGGTPAAMILNLEPVFTVALAAVVLGEVVGVRQLLGGALVVAAVAVSQLWEWRAGKPA